MAKRRHEEAQNESSKLALIIMAAGAIAVAALVVWALTRTVQPAATASTATTEAAAQPEISATAPNPALPVPSDITASATQVPPTATNAATPPADENASVPRISVADLKARIDKKDVVVVDVRQELSYGAAHIPSSRHIQLATVEAQLDTLPKDKLIVTYCT